MFTDMVGYSEIAQRDETHALALLRIHNDLLRPYFARFRGREVKTVGDAFLVEFESALEAVRCALELQRELGARNAAVPVADRFEIRVGLHVGDIVRTGGDVLGDAVNIASRVEALAAPGGVVVTQQVYDQVQNKLPLVVERLPRPALKHIQSAVEVYRLVVPTTGTTERPVGGGPETGRHLAVLPLANISPDPKDEYFADGLTEELISVLSQVRGLTVIARTSVIPYKVAPKPIPDVGRELGVDTVLEGSVRKAGNRIRITLQLIDVGTQGHLWASNYNREIDDVFAVQADIAERTAQALRLELARPSGGRADRPPTANLRAYDAYLRGLSIAATLTGESIRGAAQAFEEATQLDPGFAEAYGEWADLLVARAADFVPMREVMPRARELAARAIALDPDCSVAHSALGNIAFQFDQDWELAETELRRAIELDPSNANARRWYGMMLGALDRLDEAREQTRAGIRLDPGGMGPGSLAWFDLLDGKFDDAIAWARGELAAAPNDFGRAIGLGLFLATAGRLEEARPIAERPLPAGTDEMTRYHHALLRAYLGMPDEAREIIAETERGAAPSYTSATDLAILYSALGNGSRALDLLEQEAETGDKVLWNYYRGLYFDPIRTEPRFRALLERYRLPDRPVRRARAPDPGPSGGASRNGPKRDGP